MAVLSAQQINRAGAVPSYAAAAGGGDSFPPGQDTWLHAKNGSGGAITITVVTPGTDAIGNAVADTVVSVGAGAERVWGPFPAVYYANPATGNADITYSAVTTLTIGAFNLVNP